MEATVTNEIAFECFGESRLLSFFMNIVKDVFVVKSEMRDRRISIQLYTVVVYTE